MAQLPFDGGADGRTAPGGIMAPQRPFNGTAFISGQRHALLDRRSQYYESTQHDWKRWDFEGRPRQPGQQIMQPLIDAQSGGGRFVPIAARRPSNPYRLPRVIVNAFTNLVFGERRWPNLRAPGDATTQEFGEALSRASALQTKMIRARNIGGSTGSCAVSWCFRDGLPRVQVHQPKHIFVSEWADREELIPLAATECYVYAKEVWDPERRAVVEKLYWYRRDWTPDGDVAYADVEYKRGQEPQWQVDAEASGAEHGDGYPHIVWVQNHPSEEIDGIPDYEGLYEVFDTLDVISSVLARGGVLNLDPTLVLKMDPDILRRVGVKKGSDNGLAVGLQGDAKYLELAGTSITAGLALLDAVRKYALEVAQCVVPDPNEVAAAGVSSLAMKLLYQPSLAVADIHREQYGQCVRRILEQMTASARNLASVTVQVAGDTDEPEEAEVVLKLPPKVRAEPELDDQGQPTGEETTVLEEHEPGDATSYELEWGPYFAPTPDDQQKSSAMLTAATAASGPYMSTQTASEVMASMLGRVPADEWRRLVQDKQQRQAELSTMVGGDPGAEVDPNDPTAMPDGAQPRQPEVDDKGVPLPGQAPGETQSGESKLSLNASDLAAIVTVNEARASTGLGPLMKQGKPDPDGDLTLVEFRAKVADAIAKTAKADKGVGPNDKPPPVAPGGFPPKPGQPPVPGEKVPPKPPGGPPKPPPAEG